MVVNGTERVEVTNNEGMRGRLANVLVDQVRVAKVVCGDEWILDQAREGSILLIHSIMDWRLAA